MSYIVLNGVRSSLIKGLLIQSLPPISKPLVRTQVLTIDGRDGDLVTKLGYSAYDKTMTIGLFGDYDIDQVIEYFNSEGTVIFSNEPGKFYEYQILNQIDFEKLLRFKTATVTFHVQPFKYSAVDDTIRVRSALFHLKPFEATKNGVTVKVVNGALSFLGTATENTELYLPINPIEIKTQYSQIGTEKYEMDVVGGIWTAEAKGKFTFRIITSKPTDEDSFGGTSYNVQVGNNITYKYQETVAKVYKYLWIKIESGQEFTAAFEPSISLTDTDIDSGGLTYINSGNVESKPIFTIVGSASDGGAYVYINGKVAFLVNFHSINDSVTINTQTMNAYSGNTLRNRDIEGDLSKVSFKPGSNRVDIYTTHAQVKIKEFTVERESRWI